MVERIYYRGHKLNLVKPEPLLVSLLKYRANSDRTQCTKEEANLISSRCDDGMHKPILDLDFRHQYVKSSKAGHAHLYLDTSIPFWRLALLLVALRLAGVVELGFVVWSLRRRATFVRPEWVEKTSDEVIRSEAQPQYGWLFKIRDRQATTPLLRKPGA